MKKAVCLVMTFIFMLALSSCAKGNKMLFFDKDNNLADARMEQLFVAIKEQDKGALKELFSENALMQSENIDVEVDCLLSFIQGELVSWNQDESPIVFDNIEDEGKRKQLVTWYTLDTDEQKYSVFLLDYPIDTIDSQNAGLYSLRIIKTEAEDTLVGTWEEWATPGIYICDEGNAGDGSLH